MVAVTVTNMLQAKEFFRWNPRILITKMKIYLNIILRTKQTDAEAVAPKGTKRAVIR